MKSKKKINDWFIHFDYIYLCAKKKKKAAVTFASVFLIICILKRINITWYNILLHIEFDSQEYLYISGPDGLTDQRVKTRTDFQMVGNGDRSPEVTSQMGYLSRPPPGTKFPKAKNGQIGEIGWPVETFKIVKGIWEGIIVTNLCIL